MHQMTTKIQQQACTYGASAASIAAQNLASTRIDVFGPNSEELYTDICPPTVLLVCKAHLWLDLWLIRYVRIAAVLTR